MMFDPEAAVRPVDARSAVACTLRSITRKRAGAALCASDIETTVLGYCRGLVADYQMSAWLATVACTGLDHSETVALTRAYVDSGRTLSIPNDLRPVVDKHSTGGVGDKTTLVVAPIVAACGIRVCKVSGRGLGFAGGTVDKLESVPGMRSELTAAEVVAGLRQTGLVVTGQSADLVPGDRATYALRDVTATVHSLPLIAASIMSKKIATAPDGVVLDVKFGRGGLVADRDTAAELARIMLDIGGAFGLRCLAVLSRMDQPLGRAVGNALEVREAARLLSGERVPGYSDLCETIAAAMLRSGQRELSQTAALRVVRTAVRSGAAFRQFRDWIAGQGGDTTGIGRTDWLPAAPHVEVVRAASSGWIGDIDARVMGELASQLGAGRLHADDTVDHSVGFELFVGVGDQVSAGDPLVEVHLVAAGRPTADVDAVHAAFSIAPEPVTRLPLVTDLIQL